MATDWLAPQSVEGGTLALSWLEAHWRDHFCTLVGTAIGAGLGALFGAMADVGINDQFIKKVRSQATEGTSALFLLTGEDTEDE